MVKTVCTYNIMCGSAVIVGALRGRWQWRYAVFYYSMELTVARSDECYEHSINFHDFHSLGYCRGQV